MDVCVGEMGGEPSGVGCLRQMDGHSQPSISVPVPTWSSIIHQSFIQLSSVHFKSRIAKLTAVVFFRRQLVWNNRPFDHYTALMTLTFSICAASVNQGRHLTFMTMINVWKIVFNLHNYCCNYIQTVRSASMKRFLSLVPVCSVVIKLLISASGKIESQHLLFFFYREEIICKYYLFNCRRIERLKVCLLFNQSSNSAWRSCQDGFVGYMD
ncbi:hypothetical protein T02_11692 [Trichinella nativa]|uniref:Uncharacterized protein n=1 Tax=Trichinella nativa TaxID=6335 RepID=A0A0V1KTQ5_9BILA|nr:hypothetical protein T06_692 [Trichinella sp. T6]KRZ50503.1 hypothetical protein T02_11692 [Trichinella nativa]